MNKNSLVNIAAFAIGAAAGSVVTWKLVKTKYERIANEEIESVKEVYSAKASKEKDNDTPVEPEDEDISEAKKEAVSIDYRNMVTQAGYYNYSDSKEEIDKIVEKKADKIINECKDIIEKAKEGNKEEKKDMNVDIPSAPYLIEPDELGEEYEVVTLVYYADGTLTYFDSSEIIDDPEEIVGPDALNSFDKYPDDPDTVYIRDDAAEYDYEILRDESTYEVAFS